MSKTVRIFYPASRGTKIPSAVLDTFKNITDDLIEIKPPDMSDWDFHAGSISERAKILNQILLDDELDVLVAGRGGYGASDLLPYLEWDLLRKAKHKIVVGYLDISALHSALYTKLSWPSIHGPMPNTTYWGEADDPDIQEHMKTISGEMVSHSLTIDKTWGFSQASGTLFGGCLSVLSSLIGTPYIPEDLSGHVLFFEDIDEHPAKILRYTNQWIQSGLTNGVEHILIGNLSGLETFHYPKDKLCEEIHIRTGIPVSSLELFGHCNPNFPIGIGSEGIIKNETLTWRDSNYES